MLKKIFLTGMLFFGIGIGSVFATGDSITNIMVKKLDELAATPSGGNDFVPVYDASADKDKKLDTARITFNAANNTISGDNAFTGNNTHTGNETFNKIAGGTETVTLSSADPGTGAASLTTVWSGIDSDATGSQTDTCTLADGIEGQFKMLTLTTDGETTGTAITPANFGPGTDILFEDVNDSCILVFAGGAWQIASNDGGTVR